jgi:hypothetical protein
VTREERELARAQPPSVAGEYLRLTTYRRDGDSRLDAAL